jgi:hypothetical protein
MLNMLFLLPLIYETNLAIFTQPVVTDVAVREFFCLR